MMSEVEAKAGVSATQRMNKWIVAGLLLVLVAIVVLNLPHRFSDDLSLIGTGQPAVVLVRDKNAAESMDLMNAVNSVRNQFKGRVLFLLTDYDTPEGRAFIAANNAAPMTLVLFDAAGKPVKVLAAPQTAENVQSAIAAIPSVKYPKTSGRAPL
ncbi:MAG: hypothetical protein WBM09_04925 [Gallionella sp.]